jgi:hypothetical protein
MSRREEEDEKLGIPIIFHANILPQPYKVLSLANQKNFMQV